MGMPITSYDEIVEISNTVCCWNDLLPAIRQPRPLNDVQWHLIKSNALVRRSTEMLIVSRNSLAEVRVRQASTQKRLAASWALLTVLQARYPIR
jgi:hypothetical protein